MGGLTAIELGPDTCTMVRVSVRGADVRVLDVETLDPAAFPGVDAFVGAVRHARRSKQLPRRARVVLWGLPDGATTRDSGIEPRLAPLKRAGFRIDRLVSPSNALAALARVRVPRGDGAVAWLAINRGGVAIAVVRPGVLLYAYEFPWDSSIGAVGSQARLLQRYSLVAYLAPQVRQAIVAAASRGARVEAVVTCGNLPDLRSLTMPLIEELDLEVETLDSFDGLTLKPALRDALAESAPALRVGCAGAIARASRPRARRALEGRGAILRTAALLVAAAGIGWLWLGSRTPTTPPVARTSVQEPASPASPPNATDRATSPVSRTPPVRPAPLPAAAPASRPAPVTTPSPSTSSARVAPSPSSTPSAPATPPGAKPSVEPPARAVSRPARRDNAAAGEVAPKRPTETAPELLKDPLPHITTILVSEERRFAVLDGRTVTIGDPVGRRVVTAIEPRAVVLREPSGVLIRVGLGGRFLGVEPGRR